MGEGRESRKGVKVAWGGTKREVAEGEEEASETKGGADPRSFGATKAVVSGVAKYIYSGCQLKSTILIPQVK